MDFEKDHIKIADCAPSTNDQTRQAFDKLFNDYGDSQQKGGYLPAIREPVSHGALMGTTLGVVLNWPAGGFANREALRALPRAGLTYLLKGGAAAAADTGLDLLLQKEFGRVIGGHDIFRPTPIESTGMAAAAVVPLGIKGKLLLASFSWLEGRAQNLFLDKKQN